MNVVVFDFFGVICSEIMPFVLPKYMSAAEAVAYKAKYVNDADLGVIGWDELLDRTSAIAHVPPKRLEEEFWAEVRIDGEVVKIIERLRRDRRVAMLTNAIAPFFRRITAANDIERLFEIVLVSSEVGLVKPDPAFYRLMIDRLAVRPADCLFIDDNQVNLDGARAAGMNTLLFENAAKLAHDLGLAD